MVEARQRPVDESIQNVFWWGTIGYSALAGLGWLTIAVSRFLQRQRYLGIAADVSATDPDQALRITNFAGAVLVDMVFALLATAIFAYATAAVLRRTWNGWDHATVVVGFATVLLLIMLCASGRVMRFIPLTTAPLLLLLYLPPTKAACGVRREAEPEVVEAPPATLSREEIEREIAKERTLITQLSQNLDVFEVERSMDTDRFVARYTDGLEEENADNAEWFSIARAVRRHRERLTALRAQLDGIASD